MSSIWRWKASPTSERADKLLFKAIQEGLGEWTGPPRECSRTLLQKLIESKQVQVNGKIIRSNEKWDKDSRVEVTFPEAEPLDLVPENRDLEILFEDKHLLIVNKPAGLTVHPSATQMKGTLVHALLHHIKDLSGIGGILRPGIVHRLDKDTSGALVISKTDLAHQRLVEIFSKHDIDRVYWALTFGAPSEASRRIESLIARDPKDRKKMSMTVSEGRKAVSNLRVLECYGRSHQKPFASWLEVKLETGRTHQIRVHLTGIGHSVLGDPVYGTPSSVQTKWIALPKDVQTAVSALPGQALHARVLGFLHPITGEKLFFEAKPPESFSTLLNALQEYSE